MKRRSFLKGLLFSAMIPIAVAFGSQKIEPLTYSGTPFEFDGIGDTYYFNQDDFFKGSSSWAFTFKIDKDADHNEVFKAIMQQGGGKK